MGLEDDVSRLKEEVSDLREGQGNLKARVGNLERKTSGMDTKIDDIHSYIIREQGARDAVSKRDSQAEMESQAKFRKELLSLAAKFVAAVVAGVTAIEVYLRTHP